MIYSRVRNFTLKVFGFPVIGPRVNIMLIKSIQIIHAEIGALSSSREHAILLTT